MASNKPIAVLISDIHYNLKNLELADNAMRQAIAKTNELNVPLIVAGDLHDSKANMRAECVNAMIETFKLAKTRIFIMRGNHDSINEKSSNHSLNFLKPYATIVRTTYQTPDIKSYLFAYQHNTKRLKASLSCIPRGSIVIMHQGVTGSNSGEYIQDKTAISTSDVSGLRVISGHYHQRQDIVLPDNGLWSYIGNPYTTNFAEADDPEKGFQILMEDGSLEFVPTNLRKHEILQLSILDKVMLDLRCPLDYLNPEDLLWVKVKANKDILSLVTKEKISKYLCITQPFKLDLIATDTAPKVSKKQNLTQPQLLDSIIDSLAIDDTRKTVIKDTWRTKV